MKERQQGPPSKRWRVRVLDVAAQLDTVSAFFDWNIAIVACLQTRGDQPREGRCEDKARYDHYWNPNESVVAECGDI